MSVYIVNKDGGPGGGGINRFRDYLVRVKAHQLDPDNAEAAPVLAQARVRNFWGGVYESFLLRGPAQYDLQIAKNGSFNTICSGVFFDRVAEKHDPDADIYPPQPSDSVWMGDVAYSPPPAGDQFPDPTIAQARSLWLALEAASGRLGVAGLLTPYRLQCYRAVAAADASSGLLPAWRWPLHLWTAQDRQDFDDTMAQAHKAMLDHNPEYRNAQF